MLHHSVSHGAISVLSVMSAEILVRQIRGIWPVMNIYFSRASMWLANNLPLEINPNVWNQALVALVLGMAWGSTFWFVTIRPATREHQE
jgi:hypothetical protein